jgi:hypothetical protein
MTMGALWGAVAYTILWGGTSIVITRRFVDSPIGLATLLPVRLILYGIHATERAVGHSFALSGNHAWIGFLSAGLGAMLLLVPLAVVRAAAAYRRRRTLA